MSEFEMRESKCWKCGAVNDRNSAISGKDAPAPGDVTVCIRCAAPSIFDVNLLPREPTDDEVSTIMQCPDVARIMAAIVIYKWREALINGEQ